MSTKIYTGYKINLPVHQILPFLMKFHNSLTDSDWYRQQVTLSCMYHALDAVIRIFDLPLDKNELRNHFVSLWETYIKYEIAIIPQESYTLAIVVTINEAVLQKFAEHPETQYYGYWDNMDPPKNVSEEEWENRRKTWQCLSYGIPIRRESLLWSPYTEYDYLSILALRDPSYDPDIMRLKVAKFLEEKLKIPAWKLRWKIPLLTKKMLFSNLRLLSRFKLNRKGCEE